MKPAKGTSSERSRAAIYCRVSTDEQANQGTSLDSQRTECGHFAASKNWDVVGEFVDEGVSGAKASRPQLDRLVEACRAGAIDVIIVAKLDRFSRSLNHFSTLIADLDDPGVKLASVSESIDTGTLAGELLRNILASFADFERKRIVERTSEGLRSVAAAGHWPGGPPPFGFAIDRDEVARRSTLVINEAEAHTVRTAVAFIVDEALTTWVAAERLNALGLLPRRSTRWTHHNLRRQLLDARIGGTWHYGRGPGWGRGQATTDIEVAIPALIDAQRHAALLAALASTSTGPRDPADESFYLLSRGILTGPCGGNFHGVYRRDRSLHQYRCINSRTEAHPRCECRRINGHDLDSIVWDAVTDLLGHPERLLAMASDYLGLRPEQVDLEDGQIAQLETKIATIDRARSDAAVRGLKAGLEPEDIQTAQAEMNSELAQLRAHLARLTAWQRQSHTDSERVSELMRLANSAGERLGVMAPVERRQVLDLLSLRVNVTGWSPCDECGGKGKVKGGTGGLPCPSCKATRWLPEVWMEGLWSDEVLGYGNAPSSAPLPFHLVV